MALNVKASSVLFLSRNLLFFALVSSHNVDSNSKGPSTTNSKNPIVIRPGGRFPNGHFGTCNPLNLGVCLNLLGGLVNLDLGNVPTQPCCSSIHGLANLEAAVCLCASIRANVLGIKLNLPISLSLLLNNCGGRRVPYEYICSP